MRANILARAGAVVLGLFTVVLMQVTDGYAARWDFPETASQTDTGCADKLGFFPGYFYTRIGLDENGVFPGFEVYVSDQDGHCSALLYSSLAPDNAPSLSQIQGAEDRLFVIR